MRVFGPGKCTRNDNKPIQLIGISNAIVDILAHVDDEFLAKIGAPLGSMTLIDEEQAASSTR